MASSIAFISELPLLKDLYNFVSGAICENRKLIFFVMFVLEYMLYEVMTGQNNLI